jgi:hypothetical protein
LRARQRIAELADLARHRAGALARCGTFAGALRIEDAGIHRSAAAGQRQERDGNVRVLDRKRERGTRLIAVERVVTGGGQPARAVTLPFGGCGSGFRSAGRVVAGLVAFEAGAARTEIFVAARSQEAPEAEAFIGEFDRPVRIAFAGGDGVTKPRDQNVLRPDVPGGAVGPAIGQRDGHRGNSRASITNAQAHLFAAWHADLLRRGRAVVEAPRAGRVGRYRPA